MQYLHWKKEEVKDLSPNNIASLYEKGYVFTRIGKGIMHQTRSLRVDLSVFELSSENRRIQKKVPELKINGISLPLQEYDFRLGKMAKDFYDTKFGHGIMSAQKVKEMLTDPAKSNFNILIEFAAPHGTGYAISYLSPEILHYSYPFYDLNNTPKDMGLAMMINALLYAKGQDLKYAYLGSLQRPSDVYKLQFSGLEWFDGDRWRTDTDEAKKILSNS